jgi:hypothetical protein
MAHAISASLSSIFNVHWIGVWQQLLISFLVLCLLIFWGCLLFVYLFIYFLLLLLVAHFLGAGLHRRVESMFLQNCGIHQQDYMASQREDNDLNSHCREKFKT